MELTEQKFIYIIWLQYVQSVIFKEHNTSRFGVIPLNNLNIAHARTVRYNIILFNTLRLRDLWRENADDSLKRNFFNENVRILKKNISVKMVAYVPNYKLSALVWKINWRQSIS